MEGARVEDSKVVLLARSRRRRPRCPACDGSRVTVHSYYARTLRDLPCWGRPVLLIVRLRRLRCRTGSCPQGLFVERIPATAKPYARMTTRLAEAARRFGYVLGGRPSAHLAGRLGVHLGADTILRRIKDPGRPSDVPATRVLGVDEWEWRKRERYGTILMDLEHRRVVDLLPVRSAETFACWLRAHPGVEFIARDRCLAYRKGGQRGAPTASQVHDRFHLIKNLTEAVEADAQRLQNKVMCALTQALVQNPVRRVSWREARRLRCREARYERYRAVVALAERGVSQREIVATVHVQPLTVSRWLTAGEFPERQVSSIRRRDERRLLRDVAIGRPTTKRSFSAGRVAALLVKPPGLLTEAQRSYLDAYLALCPSARELRRLALRFRTLLRLHAPARLDARLDGAIASGFHYIASYAARIRRDLAAVKAAIATPSGNGALEGHVNRLKVI